MATEYGGLRLKCGLYLSVQPTRQTRQSVDRWVAEPLRPFDKLRDRRGSATEGTQRPKGLSDRQSGQRFIAQAGRNPLPTAKAVEHWAKLTTRVHINHARFSVSFEMMKGKLVLSLIFVFIAYIPGHTQEERLNVIKINPFSWIVGTTSLFYERGLTPRSSVQLGLSYMNLSGYKVPVSGFVATAEYRWHVRKKDDKTPRGFYLSPWARYQDFSFSQPIALNAFNKKPWVEAKAGLSMSQYAIGFDIGTEVIKKKGFTFDIYAGPYYNTTSFGVSAGYSVISVPVWSLPLSYVWLRSGIAFGYAF